MTVGAFNPQDDARSSTSRPAATPTGAGVRKWFNDTLKTFVRAADLNFILAQFRTAADGFGITDAEGDDTLLYQAILAAGRARLTANTTYYVRTNGSDANTGLANTAGGAWQTIQRAIDVLGAMDLNGFTATIQVADGAYTAGASRARPFLNGSIVIQGNVTTPANVTVTAAGANIPFTFWGCAATLQGFKLASTSGTLLSVSYGASITLGVMEFGATSGNQIVVTNESYLTFSANYTVSGGAASHLNTSGCCYVAYGAGITVTLTGTPVIGYFLSCLRGSTVFLATATFSGAASGISYRIDDSVDLRFTTATDLDSVLPGDTPGAINPRPDGVRGFRNLLMNATGRLQYGWSVPCNDDAYGLHNRWYALTQSGAITPTTLTDVQAGLPHMIRLTNSLGSAQRIGYAQIVEGKDCKHLRGRQVSLSGFARMNAAGSLRYAILEWTGTEDAVTSDVVNNWTSASYTPGNFFLASNITVTATGTLALAANAVTPFSISGAVSSAMNNLIVMIWSTGTVAASTGTLDLVAQLEEGGSSTRIERRPVGYEEYVCGRYYASKTVQSQNGARHIPLPRMRAAPSVTASVGTVSAVTADGFELTHTAAAACTITASAEL